MTDKSRSVPRSRRGFTLAETMIAMVLMSLVGLIVTGGIATASRVYGRIQDRANAELLLSTTLIEMRNELDRAEELTLSGTTLQKYRTSTGNWREIENDKDVNGNLKIESEKDKRGIFVVEYQGYVENQPQSAHLMVSNEAASEHLYATFDSITYTETTDYTKNQVAGVFTVNDLKVLKDGKILARVGDDEDNSYKIRSLNSENVRVVTGFVSDSDSKSSPVSPANENEGG